MMEFQKKVVFFVFITVTLFFYTQAFSVEKTAKKNTAIMEDCSVHTLKSFDNKFLTKKEEIAKLDEALLDSLNKRDRCEQKMQVEDRQKANSMVANNAQSGSDEGSDGSAEGQNKKTETSTLGNQSTDPLSKQKSTAGLPMNNGASPKDIPPADNDTLLQKQIRAAALKEKDPEKKKKLWDMYRKYKHE